MKKIKAKDIVKKIFEKITEDDAHKLLEVFKVQDKSGLSGFAVVQNNLGYLRGDDFSKTLGVIKKVELVLSRSIDEEFTIELDDDVDLSSVGDGADVEEIIEEIEDAEVEEVDEITSERLEEIKSGEVEAVVDTEETNSSENEE